MRRDVGLALGCLAAFGVLTAALVAGGPLTELDLALHRWAEAHLPAPAETVGRVLNRLGQFGALMPLSLVLAGWLGLRRRAAGWWQMIQPPLYVAIATVLVVPTVLVIKHVTERGAPSSPLPAEQTVPLMGPLPAGEYATGYPGGHVVNGVVWYGVLLALIVALCRSYGRPPPPRWLQVVIRVVPPVLLLIIPTYLSFHWFTDGLAGLAYGLAVDRVLRLVPWQP